MSKPDWKKRAQRARELISDKPASAELLRFYAPVLDFQGRVHDAVADRAVADRGRSLTAQLDPGPLVGVFPELLTTAEMHGTLPLRETARELRRLGETRWRELLLDYMGGQGQAQTARTEDFFSRACVEPYAEHLASQLAAESPQTSALCPACARKPMLAVLRPEGEGARRSLVCSFCLTEWDFLRLLCPSCGEDKELNLPIYTSEGLPYVRVESCDVCHHYLLAVDLSRNGLAVPLVDQVAAAPLDLWAAEKGYSKIATNLLGM
jgi:FdhE protein